MTKSTTKYAECFYFPFHSDTAFANSRLICSQIDKSSADVAETKKLDLDKDRKCRTMEEMAAEAMELHALFL